MIDVVFLILLFFVVSTLLNVEWSIDLELPVAESGEKGLSLASPPVVSVPRDGVFSIEGQTFGAGDLASQLQRLREAKGGQVLVIRSDGNVKHQTVIFLMDVAKKTGFGKLSVITLPPE